MLLYIGTYTHLGGPGAAVVRAENGRFELLDACAATGAVFEVNTGGMFRGYCGEPYPSRFLLEALRKSGARVTVNADAHCTEAVRFRFDETLALLRDIGFTAVTVLEDGMFVEKPL